MQEPQQLIQPKRQLQRILGFETMNNIDAISMNVMNTSIPAAVAMVISFDTTVGPKGPIK